MANSNTTTFGAITISGQAEIKSGPRKEFIDFRQRLAKVDSGANLATEGLNEYLRKLDTGEIEPEVEQQRPEETIQAVILKGKL